MGKEMEALNHLSGLIEARSMPFRRHVQAKEAIQVIAQALQQMAQEEKDDRPPDKGK